MPNIEIFYLYRQITKLQRSLIQISVTLSDSLPIHVINDIQRQFFNSFIKLKQRLNRLHMKKLDWLLIKKNKALTQSIEPISFTYTTNLNDVVLKITPGTIENFQKTFREETFFRL